MGLTDDELRGVLTRAEAIQGLSSRVSVTDAEMEAFIQAAEEVGFSRTAVEQALRELLKLPMRLPAVGELTFARSADGKFYVAEVMAASQENMRVRFLRGSEHTLAVDDLRACSFLPGERVVCNSPWWGPHTCTVESYDAARKRVKLNDGWGETRWYPIAQVWLNQSHQTESTSRLRARVSVALIGAGAAIGALVGSIVTAVMLR